MCAFCTCRWMALTPSLLRRAGDGSYGQLGSGQGSFSRDSYNSSVPVQVVGGTSFAQVCTGDRHSCALEPSGKAWCWGESNCSKCASLYFGRQWVLQLNCPPSSNPWLQGSMGMAGWGMATKPAQPRLLRLRAAMHSVPLPVEAATHAPLIKRGRHGAGVSQTAGYQLNNAMIVFVKCMLRSCPTMRLTPCWIAGWNDQGQLGTGQQNVSSNVPAEAAAICAGSGFTCGVDNGGRALCWGALDFLYGRLLRQQPTACLFEMYVQLRLDLRRFSWSLLLPVSRLSSWVLQAPINTESWETTGLMTLATRCLRHRWRWLAATLSSPSAVGCTTCVPWSRHRRPERGAGG